ncbi:enoyl-CoA hydratase/isomerase family protein [Octadecabacter ascidiaceicola]|uniref:3-hydroxyisobutyryl-CoA hydrolase n=1 Tax=Octadecabacter ascidiaceicola TaxID=1655543 RepID=A0A238JLV2_9RHOB|nr:enoyl-CoA hydratase/isomerase family protein [Octadecabacter ascidiaceicola]SMX30892.1 2,3-dehydroadipyl-CoA hydratase [Octadecabacter ascidiaceicola]
MSEIVIRKEGKAGRATLNRPGALNALTAAMALALEDALDQWRDDVDVAVVVIDAAGEKAFCAGGDIAELYAHGTAGDFDFGRAFWWQEYRLNLKIATYPKPIVVFMQGFVMGGGVGVAGHASHRIVGESTKIAMPECGIGLMPDVGGTFLLGRAPGEAGVYLGLTGGRMGPADAITATFADYFVPEAEWGDLKTKMIDDADLSAIEVATKSAPEGTLVQNAAAIDDLFAGQTISEIAANLANSDTEFAAAAAKKLSKGAPLSLACALVTIRQARQGDLKAALQMEYRFSYRAQEQGDFLEGIRAQIIDRDFKPKWQHADFDVPPKDIDTMLAGLGPFEWTEERDMP